MTQASLPAAVVEVLDGTRPEDRVGLTFQLTSVDGDGWPRQALLSVGEVLATGDDEVRLALYPSSRTTAALAAAGRGLLTVVVGGAVHKVTLTVEELAAPGAALRCFRGAVAAVDVDTVGYAQVLHGIEYRLLDEPTVLARWRQQLGDLRAAR